LPGRLGDAEIDHLRDRDSVMERDQDVRRLDVAVDDPLLMRMLHGLANHHKEIQTVVDAQTMPVAVFGDWDATDELHDEVGAAGADPPWPPLRGVSPFGEGEGKKMTSALFENSGNLAMLFFLWSASRQLPKAWRPFGW